MEKVLAVIETASQPRQLVQTDGTSYWSIPGITTLADALRIRSADFRALVNGPMGNLLSGIQGPPIADEVEVWGAGVTYLRSRDARKEESGVPDVYQRVYEAERPELFLKSLAGRCIGNGAEIGIREDATASVPEPEVAIVINRFQEIIGLTICNDVTARSIEGENPLYLSQAKIYIGSTSLGPVIKPIWQISDYAEIGIQAKITRGSKIEWEAQTSLAALHRTFDDLVSYLFRCQVFPNGAVLSTGTGIIPPMDIALEPGDVVTISVDGIGTLENPVAEIPLESNYLANQREGKL